MAAAAPAGGTLLDQMLALPAYAHLRDIVLPEPKRPPPAAPPPAPAARPEHDILMAGPTSSWRDRHPHGEKAISPAGVGPFEPISAAPRPSGGAPPQLPQRPILSVEREMAAAPPPAALRPGARAGISGGGAAAAPPPGAAEERPRPGFITAGDKLAIDERDKPGARGAGAAGGSRGNGRSLGLRRGRGGPGGFVSPLAREDDLPQGTGGAAAARLGAGRARDEADAPAECEYKGVDPKMAEMILNEVLDKKPGVSWDDVAGLDFAKQSVLEAVVWPIQRPDLFTGLRQPSKGLLLFGPPGTGKTLIGKAIATESGATFFSISASSLMSKWIGEAEKMVRALFTVARAHLPAVIFVDEIDSLLCQRSEGDQDSTRRVKTEFLVQLDGAATNPEDRLLLIGATNRPQELDEAARRRMQKRLYIPLPDARARHVMLGNWLRGIAVGMSEAELAEIVRRTDGYSGSDMNALVREAAMGPMRDPGCDVRQMSADAVRPILQRDFEAALCQVRASVARDQLDTLVEWDKQFGSFGRPVAAGGAPSSAPAPAMPG